MTTFVLPVQRVLVVDSDAKFLATAVASMRPTREVEVERDLDVALDRCRAERFDLVISDVYFRGKHVGINMIMTLYSEPQTRRRLALVTRGLSVRSALGLRALLPEEIIIREKRNDVFESILHEAETGEMPDDWWDDGIPSFEKAKRDLAHKELVRAGNNRSRTARRLGVSRATIVRHTNPTPG